MRDKPAIIGGTPAFVQKLPIVRPVLTPFSELAPELESMLQSGMVTKGKHLSAFEAALAKKLGVRNVVAVSSCTSGMMLVHRALGLEGEVIVPSFTFIATIGALIWAGLTPRFVDVDRETTNVSPAAVEAAIGPRTSAIVAVHNFGNPADVEALAALAKRHGLKLIYDAAHGLGARVGERAIGTFGDAEAFSLSPTKLITTGEGGLVTTNDDALAEKVRVGREYGNPGSYDCVIAGLNARMAEFNALLGLHQLGLLDENVRTRNQSAELYRARLAQVPGVDLQVVRARNVSSYKDFSITVQPDRFGIDRDQLARALAAEGIDTRNYYDPPTHRQTAYRAHAPRDGALPNTDWLSAHSLSLPMHSRMSPELVERICDAIQRIHAHAAELRGHLAG